MTYVKLFLYCSYSFNYISDQILELFDNQNIGLANQENYEINGYQIKNSDYYSRLLNIIPKKTIS